MSTLAPIVAPIVALGQKDLRLLLRDKFALFWVLAFPLMFALFFGSIFGSESDGDRVGMALAIVDEDGSDAAKALIAQLAANDAVRIERRGDGAADAATAPFATMALPAAREAVQKGRKTAYLRIPRGYGDSPFAAFGGGDPDQPGLEIGIDPGRRAEAGVLQGVVMQSMFSVVQARFRDPETLRKDMTTARAQIGSAADLDPGQKVILQTFLGAVETFFGRFDLGAVGAGGGASDTTGGGGGFGARVAVVDVTRDRGKRPRSTFDVTFPQALVWGLMSVAMSFAITLVRERSSGTLLRLRMAPIGRAQLLAGKAFGCFVACMLAMAALLAFGVVALGVRVDSVLLLLLGMACTAACFTGVMMTISMLGRTENAVAGSSWGLMMPFAMIGGGMIPLIAMPGWLVTASAVSPFKWAILAIEGAVWRGFTLGDMALPCGLLVAIGGVFAAVGIAVFRRVEG
ncbi:MAG: ABC transporter permease [Planctomycetota bacterium]